MEKPLVSVVVPVYNAEKYVRTTILSVQKQGYENWELFAIDDCSTDTSLAILKEIAEEDSRVHIIQMEKNSGVGVARNAGVSAATGRFLAFLDADDVWVRDKLEKQLQYMKQLNSAFTFTAYEFARDDGTPNGTVVQVPTGLTEKGYLKNNLIWTCTVMIDLQTVNKSELIMPALTYGEDAVTWCRLLRISKVAHGLNEVTAYYRRTSTSLSANKLLAIVNKAKLYWSFKHIHPLHRMVYCAMSLVAATRKRL